MSAGAKGDPAAGGEGGGASPEGLPGWECHPGAVRDRGAGVRPSSGPPGIEQAGVPPVGLLRIGGRLFGVPRAGGQSELGLRRLR